MIHLPLNVKLSDIAVSAFSRFAKLFLILFIFCRQKWFRGRKIHTDWDIRVEQCQFSELAITADTEEGISVGIVSVKNGQRSVK